MALMMSWCHLRDFHIILSFLDVKGRIFCKFEKFGCRKAFGTWGILQDFQAIWVHDVFSSNRATWRFSCNLDARGTFRVLKQSGCCWGFEQSKCMWSRFGHSDHISLTLGNPKYSLLYCQKLDAVMFSHLNLASMIIGQKSKLWCSDTFPIVLDPQIWLRKVKTWENR